MVHNDLRWWRSLGHRIHIFAFRDRVFVLVRDDVIVGWFREEADANRAALAQFGQEIDRRNRAMLK